MSDAERKVGRAVARFLYRHRDPPLERAAGEAAVRALADPTPAMIEASERAMFDNLDDDAVEAEEIVRRIIVAYLRAETREEES